MGVWDHFRTGQEARGALDERRGREDDGAAFQAGGYGAAERSAAGRGDFERAGQIGDRALDHARHIAGILNNAATGLLDVPYEERAARLADMRPMLEELGIPGERLDAFDPTDAAIEDIRALNGKFSAFEDIEEVNGQIVGIRADGQHEVLGEIPAALPAGHRREGDGVRPMEGSSVPGMTGYRYGDEAEIEETPGYGGSRYAQAQDAIIGWNNRRTSGRGGMAGGAAGEYTLANLAPQERTYINTARQNGIRYVDIIRQLDRFEHLNRTQDTGDLAGLNIFDNDVQEMRSISEGLVSFMRQPGEGAMSDGDAARFRASLPSVNKYGEANSNIIAGFRIAAQNAADYPEFLEWYAGQNGTTTGATEMWNEYLEGVPILDEDGNYVSERVDWRTFFEAGGEGGEMGGDGDGGDDPLGLRGE